MPSAETLRGLETWKVQDSIDLYNIHKWGAGYFSVNEGGSVTVLPEQDPGRAIDLHKLVSDLQRRGLGLPLLIRFPDMFRHRLQTIHDAFARSRQEYGYRGSYCGIFPIKVNQQRHIVSDYIRFGAPLGFGIEAGSKPELLAVLAMTSEFNMPIVCNGFKDDEFIELVVLAAKMGKDITPIIEKYSELRALIKYAKAHNTPVKVGLRVKLTARGAGRWEHSAGARSKFGLTLPEILRAVDELRENGMLDYLRLLHFHAGSQITNIRTVKGMLTEAARIYVELVKLGAPMGYLDVGGGLGVDYDGSQTNFDSSMNYTLQEYANDVVFRIQTACDNEGVDHPTILSESGRAMVSYHSVLVFNVLGTARFDTYPVPEELPEDAPDPLRELRDIHKNLSVKNIMESYHDAAQAREEIANLFNVGNIDLRNRAHGEAYFWAIATRVLRMAHESSDELPEDLESLEKLVSDIYFCNFSLFQSMPDSWAIRQLFPVMPIHRLGEEPTRRGVLADITCDSDGKIDQFVDLRDVKSQLELHEFTGKENYWIAAFLIGAYQEILGDLHNLLGDTNTVAVSLDDKTHLCVEHIVKGDRVDEVLRYVGYDPNGMTNRMRQSVEKALREDRVTLEESHLVMEFFETGMSGYTYLE